MKVTYHQALQNDQRLSRAAEQATATLEAVLNHFKDSVDVEWDRTEDERGRPVVALRLADWSGSVLGKLTPEELRDPVVTKIRLQRLWDDLLQVRSGAHVKQLRDMVAQLDGE